MIKKLILSITLFTAFLIPVSAFATTVTVSPYSGQNVDFSYTFGNKTQGWGGLIGASFSSPDFFSSAYCVDINIGLSAQSYTVEGFSDVSTYNDGNYTSNSSGLNAAWLMNKYSSGLGYHDYTIGEKQASEAGLQLAIWKALYGDSFEPVTTGSFTTSEAMVYYVDYTSDLNSADLSGFSGENFKVAKLDGGQDLLIYDPVPEPTTLLLFGIGLLGISAIGRKRKA